MSPQSAKSNICAEKERLSKKLLKAVSELTALQNAQGANLISGGDGLPRIEIAIEAARKRWENARTVLATHLDEHGC
jgi:hypothetical protein